MKLIRTVRTHWKKSVFFSGLLTAGGIYGFNRYQEDLLLRQYCRKLQSHSRATVATDHQIKEIVVFLNPSSCGGKAAKTFKKFAVPLLSCSGINFVVVPTSYEGHVSSLLKYLPANTSAVVVAGGDGMLQDTVTAVLRSSKHRDLPVGFIPLGTHNTFISRILDGTDSLTKVDVIGQSVTNIVQGNIKPVPIMEISPAKGNTIFATSYLTWGSVKAAIDFIPKFWWLGSLQTAAAMLRYSTSTVWPCNITARVNGKEEEELANLTVVPGDGGLALCYENPVELRGDFLKQIGSKIIEQRHSGLLDKLTLGQPLSGPYHQEVDLVPVSQGKFFVDGESVDCRTIKIKYLTDSLSMFVPSDTLPVERVDILPQTPRSVLNFVQSCRDFLGIG